MAILIVKLLLLSYLFTPCCVCSPPTHVTLIPFLPPQIFHSQLVQQQQQQQQCICPFFFLLTAPSLLAERVQDDLEKLRFLCSGCALGKFIGTEKSACLLLLWKIKGVFVGLRNIHFWNQSVVLRWSVRDRCWRTGLWWRRLLRCRTRLAETAWRSWVVEDGFSGDVMRKQRSPLYLLCSCFACVS